MRNSATVAIKGPNAGPIRKFARIAAARSLLLAYAGTTIMAAMLIVAIALTSFHPRWAVFLAGVLAAAILATTSRAANARWIIARRTSQLNAVRAKLAAEIRGRARTDESFARMRANATLIDESFPAMLTYVDAEERVRYHNRAYTRWIGLEGEVIDGQSINELIGSPAYAQVDKHLKEAMVGKDVRYERTQTMPNGSICRLHVQYLPRYGEDGKVAGVFTILTDITRADDVADNLRKGEQEATDVARKRLVSALAHEEFTLFCQPIAALGGEGGEVMHEVLLRMNVEEENHLPAGAFITVSEEVCILV
jgi:PAS domain S-box-containing protein